jgi:hypothetical protein
MDSIKWVSRIRSELKCGIVDFYALQNAFEITATRLVGDERYTLVVIHSFKILETKSDILLDEFIDQYKAKWPPFFKFKPKKVTE